MIDDAVSSSDQYLFLREHRRFSYVILAAGHLTDSDLGLVDLYSLFSTVF